MGINLSFRKRNAASKADSRELETVLKSAIASYLGTSPDKIELTSFREVTPAQAGSGGKAASSSYLNTDGRERNEELYSKSKWKSL